MSVPVLTLTSDPSSSQPAAALVQLQDGSVMRYQAGAELRALPGWACLRSPCQQVAATPDAALQAAGLHLTGLACLSKAVDGPQLLIVQACGLPSLQAERITCRQHSATCRSGGQWAAAVGPADHCN